eukprot:gene18092-biopygen856
MVRLPTGATRRAGGQRCTECTDNTDHIGLRAVQMRRPPPPPPASHSHRIRRRPVHSTPQRLAVFGAALARRWAPCRGAHPMPCGGGAAGDAALRGCAGGCVVDTGVWSAVRRRLAALGPVAVALPPGCVGLVGAAALARTRAALCAVMERLCACARTDALGGGCGCAALVCDDDTDNDSDASKLAPTPAASRAAPQPKH